MGPTILPLVLTLAAILLPLLLAWGLLAWGDRHRPRGPTNS
jgi:hypothetical protein